jgi:small-conductance mechanosensitive channel
MTLTTERQPTAAEIRARVDAARAEAAKADQRIAELRAQDARLESESAALLGEALAAGTSPQAEVRVKRERRAAIAKEIEALRARVVFLTTSADQSDRALHDAEIRDARASLAEAQRGLADRLTVAEPLLRELREIWDQIVPLRRAERLEHESLTTLLIKSGQDDAVRSSEVGASGPVSVITDVLDAILARPAFGAERLHDEAITAALTRLAEVRDAAAAAAKANA